MSCERISWDVSWASFTKWPICLGPMVLDSYRERPIKWPLNWESQGLVGEDSGACRGQRWHHSTSHHSCEYWVLPRPDSQTLAQTCAPGPAKAVPLTPGISAPAPPITANHRSSPAHSRLTIAVTWATQIYSCTNKEPFVSPSTTPYSMCSTYRTRVFYKEPIGRSSTAYNRTSRTAHHL